MFLEVARPGRPGLADDVAEAVVPDGLDDDVVGKIRPVDDRGEQLGAGERAAIGTGRLAGGRVVQVDAGDLRMHAGGNAERLEVQELDEPGGENEEADQAVNEQCAVERDDRVALGYRHHSQCTQRYQ